MTNYSQLDPAFKKLTLGKSGVSFPKYGCTTCAIVNAANDLGFKITPKEAVKKLQYTKDGKILWPSVSELGLKFEWRGYTYDAKRIQTELKTKKILLEFSTTNPNLRHWMNGDEYQGEGTYICRNPYGGLVGAYPSGAYPKIMGYTILSGKAPEIKPSASTGGSWIGNVIKKIPFRF